MRHFDFLDDEDRTRLFFREPESFTRESEPELLAMALGATLYSPATRPELACDIARRSATGATSVVLCLEDSIPDKDVPAGEVNVIAQLRLYGEQQGRQSLSGDQQNGGDGPLIFIRVRSPYQIPMIMEGLGEHATVLSGFVLPKFTEDNGAIYLDTISAASDTVGRRVLAMPVMESPDIAFAESRVPTLVGLRDLLEKYRSHVLAVRLGATDISGVYGLRRSREHTVYDIGPIAAVITDVVNLLGRADNGYVITGPVWEYFSEGERLFKPQLRESPFIRHDERKLRARLIAADLDGLIREVTLDRANGLTGKSVIHPSHVAAVNALSVVSHEEYLDATDILGTSASGGVASSAYRNKMNESKPHTAWARRTARRARAFGVANEEVDFVDLLGASLSQ
ncbi:HpcH/HpaI aldolase/citrate lyase family protein [Jatrophihabitans sp.]|uniref:HpcH/HpaI aldolase/citrate lyase family protein n=1 Tax=Jatrophihabitans sp. TaxID=1932789 RepID=UPI0030C7790E|nr:citrate lyase beta subunit [Jatrophihabitans sp.]